jgi:hypothetical protein
LFSSPDQRLLTQETISLKKNLLLLLLIPPFLLLQAQNTEELVQVEKAFEKTCLEKGIRDGFSSYVDSQGIIITMKGPENAKKFWASLSSFDGVFRWSPTWAELSVSGDWGYSTGNYEHRAKTLEDTVNETGQYTTVWHKNNRGEWKYLIDIGNDHQRLPLDMFSQKIEIEKYSAGNNTDEAVLIDQEKQFILSYEKNISDAYQKYGSAKYILNLTGYTPVTSTDSAVVLIKKKSASLRFHPDGAKISPGKDMALVYGSFDHDQVKGSYLRIWRNEKNGWKIALEVIKIK